MTSDIGVMNDRKTWSLSVIYFFFFRNYFPACFCDREFEEAASPEHADIWGQWKRLLPLAPCVFAILEYLNF